MKSSKKIRCKPFSMDIYQHLARNGFIGLALIAIMFYIGMNLI